MADNMATKEMDAEKFDHSQTLTEDSTSSPSHSSDKPKGEASQGHGHYNLRARQAIIVACVNATLRVTKSITCLPPAPSWMEN